MSVYLTRICIAIGLSHIGCTGAPTCFGFGTRSLDRTEAHYARGALKWEVRESCGPFEMGYYSLGGPSTGPPAVVGPTVRPVVPLGDGDPTRSRVSLHVTVIQLHCVNRRLGRR